MVEVSDIFREEVYGLGMNLNHVVWPFDKPCATVLAPLIAEKRGVTPLGVALVRTGGHSTLLIAVS